MKNITFLFLIFIATCSCTKIIDIDLNTASPQVVIEGNINDQDKVFDVKITQTVKFSDSNSFPPIQGASVTISDNVGNSEFLKENQVGVYQTKTTKGVSGRTYTLKVVANGKTYISTSTMPSVVKLEGVKITESAFQNGPPGEKNYDILPQFLDPENVVNYYFFNQYVNGTKDKGFFNVLNDTFINGRNNVQTTNVSQDLKLKSKDLLKVEMLCIDKGLYDYYYSLSQLSGGSGATPANPVSNISGGCLGYFGAYTIRTLTTNVP
jgi:hypothetical protein